MNEPPRPRRRRPNPPAEPWWERRNEYLADTGRVDEIEAERPYQLRRQKLVQQRQKLRRLP